MFTNLIVSLLAPFAGAAADPTPIGAAIVQIVIDDPATGGPLCDSYRSVMDTIASLPGDQQVWIDVTDAYSIIMLEGDSLRLDNDARSTLTNWLHSDCS